MLLLLYGFPSISSGEKDAGGELAKIGHREIEGIVAFLKLEMEDG